MAFSILSQMPAERRSVDSIGITRNAKGKWIASGSGEFADLAVDDKATRISFTHTAASLPWVVPSQAFSTDEKWVQEPQAPIGYELTKAGHKLSNERLKVSGLAPGNYQISIDGKPTGEPVSHLRLATKIELQSNSATPQYQQSLEVAHLNRERNDLAIRPLRGVWGQIKGLRRKLAESDPQAFGVEYAKRQPRIEELLALAAEYDEKIHAAAQPKAREYVIERVKQ